MYERIDIQPKAHRIRQALITRVIHVNLQHRKKKRVRSPPTTDSPRRSSCHRDDDVVRTTYSVACCPQSLCHPKNQMII